VLVLAQERELALEQEQERELAQVLVQVQNIHTVLNCIHRTSRWHNLCTMIHCNMCKLLFL
jgi:hypothetical protein